MANLSRSPSLIQVRSASPLKKSVDLSSSTPNFFSPSDSFKKNFGLKNCAFEKENEQDPVSSKPTKGRSSVMMSSPKGAPFQKNFMAPTISASSKAVDSSCQRKRVLGERNEMVKSSYTSAQTEMIPGPAVRFPLASTQVGEITDCTEKLLFSSPQIKEQSPANGGVKPETATQTDLLQSAPFPPYDPKVNYLSPRPRFLHYKPKSRADLPENELDFLETNSDPRSLEDSFSFECSDDAISVQREEEDNLFKEVTLPQIEFPKIELQPSRATAMSAKLKIGHVLLVLLIGCICLPLSDSPMIASYSNPKVPQVKFADFHTILLEVSSNLNGLLPECFSYPYAREASFPREMNIVPLANLTCVVEDKESSTSDVTGKGSDLSGEYKMETVREDKETEVSFEMVQRENEVSEVQIRYEIGKIEEEEEKEIEADAGSILEQQDMATSSTMSNTKKDPRPEKLEKSEPILTKNPEPELVENQEVKDPEPIMTENPEPKLPEFESESDNMYDEEQIKISKRAAQGMSAVVVLLSLGTAVAAMTFVKKNQNRVLAFDSTRGDKTPGLVQRSIESQVPRRISLHHNSALDMDEFSSSSYEVGTDACTYTSTPRKRQARRESDVSSGSYGSYVSFEKISSMKGNREGDEMMTPVRRSSRLRNLTISS